MSGTRLENSWCDCWCRTGERRIVPAWPPGIHRVAQTPRNRTIGCSPAARVRPSPSRTALQLVKEGKIGLDDKVEKYLGSERWFSRFAKCKGHHRSPVDEPYERPCPLRVQGHVHKRPHARRAGSLPSCSHIFSIQRQLSKQARDGIIRHELHRARDDHRKGHGQNSTTKRTDASSRN